MVVAEQNLGVRRGSASKMFLATCAKDCRRRKNSRNRTNKLLDAQKTPYHQGVGEVGQDRQPVARKKIKKSNDRNDENRNRP